MVAKRAKTASELKRIYEEGLVGNGPTFKKLTEKYREKERKSTEGFGSFKDFEPFKKPKPNY